MIASRQLRDDTTVFAGVGVPLLAAALAKQRHAPRLTMVIEGGIIGPQIAPGRLPVSTNEMRAGHRATMLPGITDAFLFAQRGFVDVGFMGGAQIDPVRQHQHERHRGRLLEAQGSAARYGRAPTTSPLSVARSSSSPPTRSAGSSKRVDFITSPAWLEGDDSRRRAGLLFGGVSRVVTTLGLFGFDPDTRRMRIEATHPGVSIDVIQARRASSWVWRPR